MLQDILTYSIVSVAFLITIYKALTFFIGFRKNSNKGEQLSVYKCAGCGSNSTCAK